MPTNHKVALVVERAAFEKLALGRAADVSEFLDRSDLRPWARAGPTVAQRQRAKASIETGVRMASVPPVLIFWPSHTASWRSHIRQQAPVQFLSADQPSRRFMTASVEPRRSLATARATGIVLSGSAGWGILLAAPIPDLLSTR